MVIFSSPNASLHDLLRAANIAGATFRLAGGNICVTAPPDRTLRPLLDALRARRDEVWEALGGALQDAPSLALIAALGVTPVVPNTADEALTLIAEMKANADIHSEGLLGLDIETAANSGEEMRPTVKLRLRDGRPAKSQASLQGGAGLDPHRSRIRLVQLYGGGKRCLVLDTDVVPLAVIADVLQRRTFVIHNAGFELRFFAEAAIEIPQFEDTMQAAGLLLGVHRRSLEDAASAYLGIDVPKGLQTSDWSAPRLSPVRSSTPRSMPSSPCAYGRSSRPSSTRRAVTPPTNYNVT